MAFELFKGLVGEMTRSCPACGKRIGMTGSCRKLSDGTEICISCFDKVRIMYPVRFSENPEYTEYYNSGRYNDREKNPHYHHYSNLHDSDDIPDRYLMEDPVYDLDQEQFKAACDSVPSYINGLKEQYGGYDNVFVIDRIGEIPADGKIKSGPYSSFTVDPGQYMKLEGRVVLGCIYDNDKRIEYRHIAHGLEYPCDISYCGYIYPGHSSQSSSGCSFANDVWVIVAKGDYQAGDTIVSK